VSKSGIAIFCAERIISGAVLPTQWIWLYGFVASGADSGFIYSRVERIAERVNLKFDDNRAHAALSKEVTGSMA
jgi:hypothetical protein